MRAALVAEFGPPATLVIREVDPPRPGPGEVLVDVAAAGVNFPDVLVVAGTYQNLPPRPFIPGKELAGTVRAVGPDVGGFAAGDRVVAQVEHGAYAETVAVRVGQLVGLPDDVDPEEAAALGLVALTAWFGLVRRAAVQPGETALITGAGGGVGAAGVQLAKALGATVIGVARDESRAEVCRRHGADHVLVAGPSLREDVQRLTDGRGADVVLESVGGEVFTQCLRATAWEGRLVVVGFASGEVPTVKAGHLLVKNVSILGLQVSDYRDREPDAFRSAFRELLELRRHGRLAIPVERTFPLEHAGEALEAVRRGGLVGRVVLRCRPATAPSTSTTSEGAVQP